MRSSTHINGWRRIGTIATAAGILGLGVLLGACSGSNGSNGAAGAAGATGATGAAGPAGPAAPGSTVAVGNAVSLTATITSVTFPAAPAAVKPVVKFTLVNENGVPVTGLTASSLGFAVAKLVPPGVQLAAVPPQTAAPQPQNSTQWQSYIYLAAKPAASLVAPYVVTGTTPQPQATTERGTGTFVDNGDGSYVYTFTKDISTDAAVTYDPTLTHRVGFEIRGVAPANSPVFTVQPSTGATTGITSREIVADSTCEACHTSLSAHGGARTAVQYCVLCHNPSSIDPSTGQSIDFKVMFHKIHMGANLPDVAAGGSYFIVGYQNSVSDYSTINFPTNDLRTCYTCHDETNKATPDTVGWRQNPGTEACGSCHDTDNFVSGANHSPIALGGLKNTDCAGCHGNAATTAKTTTLTYKGTLGVADVHVIPERDYQQKFVYQILSVTNSAPGQLPVVKFQITDPTNANKAWNVLTDEPFTHCGATENANANLSIAFAYSSKDYTNIGSGVASEIAQPFTIPVTCGATSPVANGDGTFTATATTAVPAGAVGSAGVMLQGHPAHEFGNVAFFYNTGEVGTSEQEIPIPQPNAMFYAAITDKAPVARRTVADVALCDKCHDQLNGHGNNRVGNVEMCTTCHNPNATDVVARGKKGINWTTTDPTDGRGEQTIDMKVMIHAIHAGPDIAGYAAAAGFTYTPYVIYHGSARSWVTSTPFPTPAGTGPSGGPTINHCTGCHEAGTYYPPDPSGPALPSATRTDATPTATTAAAAVCSSCHITATAMDHMKQNGGSFTAAKDPVTGNVVGGSQESCVVCHSAGGIEDVAVVHKLSSFP
jgi:OmcA/MtrC family decaheme c-type cytochrome